VAIGILFTCGCATEHIPATGQTTSYGAGDDGAVRAGAAQSFTDNHDGTITDNNTGLMWEKKVQGTGGGKRCTDETGVCANPHNADNKLQGTSLGRRCRDETGTCANPHNADNKYTWSAGVCCSQTAYDGTVKTIFLNQLNNRCNHNTAVVCASNADCSALGGACGFAGHRDWRLPNKNELASIIDNGTDSPALNVAFHGANCGPACTDFTNPGCSCDASSGYWSGSTISGLPAVGWGTNTEGGNADVNNKTTNCNARAVRGGF
jgi:hypothetical protein